LEMTKEEYIRSLIDSLKDVKYIMPDDIPNIDLYMDQVTTFMDKHLKSSKRYSEDKLLTKTMINNYTKNELLPPPSKKKYTKEHMFLLIFIYYFKNILSINDIQSIFNPLTDRYYGEHSNVNLEDIYEEIFRLEKEQTDALTKDMIRKMTKAKESFPEVKDKEDQDFLTTFSFISMLCFDVYMRKHMIEKLLDSSLMGGSMDKFQEKSRDAKAPVKRPDSKKEPNKETRAKAPERKAPERKATEKRAPERRATEKLTPEKKIPVAKAPEKKSEDKPEEL